MFNHLNTFLLLIAVRADLPVECQARDFIGKTFKIFECPFSTQDPDALPSCGSTCGMGSDIAFTVQFLQMKQPGETLTSDFDTHWETRIGEVSEKDGMQKMEWSKEDGTASGNGKWTTVSYEAFELQLEHKDTITSFLAHFYYHDSDVSTDDQTKFRANSDCSRISPGWVFRNKPGSSEPGKSFGCFYAAREDVAANYQKKFRNLTESIPGLHSRRPQRTRGLFPLPCSRCPKGMHCDTVTNECLDKSSFLLPERSDLKVTKPEYVSPFDIPEDVMQKIVKLVNEGNTHRHKATMNADKISDKPFPEDLRAKVHNIEHPVIPLSEDSGEYDYIHGKTSHCEGKALPLKLPDNCKWDILTGPADSQGKCGSCYAVGGMHMMNARYYKRIVEHEFPHLKDSNKCEEGWKDTPKIKEFVENLQATHPMNYNYMIEREGLNTPVTEGCDGGFPYLNMAWFLNTNTTPGFLVDAPVTPSEEPFAQTEDQQKRIFKGGENDAYTFGPYPLPKVSGAAYLGPYGTVSSNIATCGHEVRVMQRLVQHGPISTGVSLTFCLSAFISTYHSGIIAPKPEDKLAKICTEASTAWTKIGYRRSDHAALIMGYGEENQVNYWRFQNSWGPKWGESGSYRIARTLHEIELSIDAEIRFTPSRPPVMPSAKVIPVPAADVVPAAPAVPVAPPVPVSQPVPVAPAVPVAALVPIHTSILHFLSSPSGSVIMAMTSLLLIVFCVLLCAWWKKRNKPKPETGADYLNRIF